MTDAASAGWTGEVVFTTPRLIVRTWLPDDLAPFATLNADPEVMRYLGDPLTTEQAEDFATQLEDRFRQRGFAMMPVARRSDGVFLGICGIGYTHWYPDEEIGWRFAREHWGRGYATESATAWIAWAFTDRGLSRLISVTDLPNDRSVGVMKRLGMTFDHEADLEDEGVSFRAVVHSITAEQWRAQQP